MRTFKFIFLTILAPILAVAGWLLRRREVNTIFEPDTGLAVLWTLPTISLIALSAFAVVLFFLLARRAGAKREIVRFSEAFGKEDESVRDAIAPVFILLGLLAASFPAWELVNALVAGAAVTVRDLIWSLGGLISGLCLLFLAYLGRRGRSVALLSAFPVFWLCATLIFSYFDNAMDPVLLRHVYFFFALAFLVLGFYYVAGFSFGLGRVTRLLFSAWTAIYFVGVMLGDGLPWYRCAFFLSLAAMLFLYQSLLLHKLLCPKSELLFSVDDTGDAPVDEPEYIPFSEDGLPDLDSDLGWLMDENDKNGNTP